MSRWRLMDEPQAEDDSLDDDEIVMLISLLIGAGSETTNLGGMMMIQALLEHPDELKRVRDDRRLIPQAVGEVMRYGTGGGAAELLRWAAGTSSCAGRSSGRDRRCCSPLAVPIGIPRSFRIPIASTS
jgi:hypothetical protein